MTEVFGSVLTPGPVLHAVRVLDCCYSLVWTFLGYKLDFSLLIFSESLQVFFDPIQTFLHVTLTEVEMFVNIILNIIMKIVG